MSQLVIDASVVAAWVLVERDAYADGVLDAIEGLDLVAPEIWPFEITNVLVGAERRGRLSPAEMSRARDLVRALAVVVVPTAAGRAFGEVVALAREERLTTYDASYLDLAIRLDAPLATCDRALSEAAGRRGVRVFGG